MKNKYYYLFIKNNFDHLLNLYKSFYFLSPNNSFSCLSKSLIISRSCMTRNLSYSVKAFSTACSCVTRPTSGSIGRLSLVAVHTVTNGNHYIKIVHHHFARPFVRGYSNFSNSIGQMDFSALVYLIEVIIDGRYSYAKQLCHSLL